MMLQQHRNPKFQWEEKKSQSIFLSFYLSSVSQLGFCAFLPYSGTQSDEETSISNTSSHAGRGKESSVKGEGEALRAVIECLGSEVTWLFFSYLITCPLRGQKAHESMYSEGGKPEILVNITNDYHIVLVISQPTSHFPPPQNADV